MENASKALIMAAGVLIGVLILSLAVYLFVDFGTKSREVNEQIEEKQLLQYNSQYTIYNGREDLTIYDVVSLVNLAKENNKHYTDYTEYSNGTDYKVTVTLPSDMQGVDTIELINLYNNVDDNGEIKQKFKCTGVSYYSSGRVKDVIITK